MYQVKELGNFWTRDEQGKRVELIRGHLNMSCDAVRREFEHDPDVVIVKNLKAGKRRYRKVLIAGLVVLRWLERNSQHSLAA
jgi:hypothetical protein